jgi:Raf kinase inhibitor-like YbhB/YbcL family protein
MIRARASPPEQIRGRCLIHYVRHMSAARRGNRRRWVRRAALVVLVPGLSGCGLLGGLSTTRLGASTSLTVTSPVFGTDVPLPEVYTCHGRGYSPPLQWSGTTSQAVKSFAIVVDDSEAPITPYVYWLVFHISPTTVAIGQNQLPTGARQAQNSAGKASYDPPCPVRAPHQYRFTVYALNAVIKLHNGTGLRAVWSAIASHVIAAGRLTATACVRAPCAPIRN